MFVQDNYEGQCTSRNNEIQDGDWQMQNFGTISVNSWNSENSIIGM